MCELAGEVSDGLIIAEPVTKRYTDEVMLPALDRGLARRDRSRSDIVITGGGYVGVGETEDDLRELREIIRYRVAFYSSARTSSATRDGRLGDLSDVLHDLSISGQWDRLASHISDEMLDTFAVIGRYDSVADQIAERYGQFAERVYVGPLFQQEPHPVEPTDALEEPRGYLACSRFALAASASPEYPRPLPPKTDLDQHSLAQQSVDDHAGRGREWCGEELATDRARKVIVIDRLRHDVVDGLHHRFHRGPRYTEDLRSVRVDLAGLPDQVAGVEELALRIAASDPGENPGISRPNGRAERRSLESGPVWVSYVPCHFAPLVIEGGARC